MAGAIPLKIVTGETQQFATGDFVPIANGGTGAITVAAARTSLGTGVSVFFSHALVNPVDGSTFFIGNMSGVAPSATSVARFRIESPIAGTFDRLRCTANMTTGTGESATIKINNKTAATSTTLSSAYIYDNIVKLYTSIGFAVSIGDELEIEIDNPTWATNPLNVMQYFQGFIKY